MEINKEKKIIIFENDDEFYKFAVVPKLVLKYLEDDIYYSDFKLSDEYNDYLNEGYMYKMRDRKSQILKHGAVTFRTITKKVKLKAYYGK